MHSTHNLLRVCSVVFGILAAIAGATALTALAIWLFDQSPTGSDWKELGAALALGLLAAICTLAHRSASAAVRQWPRTHSTPSAS